MPLASTIDHKAAHRARAEQAAMDSLVDRLVNQFPEVPRDQIVNSVHGHYGDYAESTVRDFVPILVERSVRSELSHHRA
jgi:hypothetical protein